MKLLDKIFPFIVIALPVVWLSFIIWAIYTVVMWLTSIPLS